MKQIKPVHIKSFIKTLFIIVVRHFLKALDWVIPKSSHLVIFASKSGKLSNANIDELWKILKTHQFYRPYKVVRKDAKANELNLFSLRSFWTILRAKYIFLTHGPGDIIYFLPSSKKIVTYVGHGVPLKSFIFTNKG